MSSNVVLGVKGSKGGAIILACPECGKSFVVPRYSYERVKRCKKVIRCSKACYFKFWRREVVPKLSVKTGRRFKKICPVCSKAFEVLKYRLRKRRQGFCCQRT